jgi:NADH-quinone oxidoreductase subunit D
MRIYEEICGARLTTNMGRIGGLKEIGLQSFELLDTFLEEFPVAWKNLKTYLKDRIFIDRVNVGAITAEQAMAYVLQVLTRAAGVIMMCV